MHRDALRLRQERFDCVSEMNKIASSTKAADITRYKELDARQKELQSQIQESESRSLLSELQTTPTTRDVARPAISSPGDQARSRVVTTLASEEYRSDFLNWMRTGKESQLLNEMRTYTPLGSTGGADGSTLVPAGFQREVEVHLKAVGGVRQVARILPTTSGNPISWPTEEDTSNNGRWLSENSAVSQTNPTFSSITLNSFLASSDQVLLPVQLVQDSAVNVEAQLAESFGFRMGRLTNAGYTNGTGTGQPSGILDGTVGVPGFNGGSQIVTAVGANSNTGNSDDTALNSVGSDDVNALIAKIDPIYRPGSVFMGNASVFDKLRSTKDKYGRPLWSVSLAVGEPDSISGYKYAFNQAMPNIAASAYSLLFGQFQKYVVRDVLGFTMVRYNELYMPNHQLGFQAFLRTEGKLIQGFAFSVLQHPAS